MILTNGGKRPDGAILYTGFFVDGGALAQAVRGLHAPRLERVIASPHVTVAFRPESVPWELIGQTARILAVGYGCDGRNEGLQVTVFANDPTLKAMIAAIPLPHITLSTVPDGQAAGTRFLTFEPLVRPIELKGIFGAALADP